MAWPSRAVAALMLVLMLTSCQQDEQPAEGLVARPPADAQPAQVVQAFIDAVNAEDADLVLALATEEFGEVVIADFGTHYTYAEIRETAALDDDHAVVGLSFIPEGSDWMTNGERLGWGVNLVNVSGEWLVESIGQG